MMLPFYAWFAGIFTAMSTFFANVAAVDGGWLAVVIQAGMAGVVVLLLMKFIPAQRDAQDTLTKDYRNAISTQAAQYQTAMQTMTERYLIALEAQRHEHREIIDHIINQTSAQQAAWRDLIARRGYCPVRDDVREDGN